jgi:hypothetical protein
MSDNDAQAVATYLKSLPAVEHRVPESTYKVSTPASYGPPSTMSRTSRAKTALHTAHTWRSLLTVCNATLVSGRMGGGTMRTGWGREAFR